MRFIELHHNGRTVMVNVERIQAVTDICPNTAVHVDGYIFYVDETVRDVMDKIKEAQA